ncbi:MAG: DUF2141 domain-containing protein [Polyangiales bacterium]
MAPQRPLPWYLIAIVAVGLTAPAAAETDPSAATAPLVVEISNIPNDKGQIGCSLYSSKDGFPSDPQKAAKILFMTPKNGRATCTFKSVTPGKYAVSVIHDEDKDGELETNIVGRPKEWWGVSNNVPAERFGPPKYEAATFDFTGEPKTIGVKLQL